MFLMRTGTVATSVPDSFRSRRACRGLREQAASQTGQESRQPPAYLEHSKLGGETPFMFHAKTLKIVLCRGASDLWDGALKPPLVEAF